MLAPKWAHAPLSGAGAAVRGGRWNEPGMAALYMSERFETAIAEYEQDLGIRPGTLCAYAVDVAGVVDLADAAVRDALDITEADLRCPWKQIAFVARARPPGWDIARRLHGLGAAGARVPSVQPIGGANLVLWRWNDAPERKVEALDPLRDLPRDQSSWPGSSRNGKPRPARSRPTELGSLHAESASRGGALATHRNMAPEAQTAEDPRAPPAGRAVRLPRRRLAERARVLRAAPIGPRPQGDTPGS
jgi:RES domain-containing protein